MHSKYYRSIAILIFVQRQFSMFLLVLWAEALTTFVLAHFLQDVFVANGLGRYSTSLQSRGQVGFLSSEMMSPFGANDFYKRFGLPKSRASQRKCKSSASLAFTWAPLPCLLSVNLGLQEEINMNMNCMLLTVPWVIKFFISDLRVLCLLPPSVWQANQLAKGVKNLRPFTVLDNSRVQNMHLCLNKCNVASKSN